MDQVNQSTQARIFYAVCAIFKRQLPWILVVVGCYYALLIISHWFILVGDVRDIMAAMAALASGTAFLSVWVLQRKRIRASHCHLLFVPTAIVALLNVYLHVFLTGDQLQLTNGILALLVFGFILLDIRLYVGLTAFSAVCYLGCLFTLPGPDTVHFVFMFVAALALSAIAFAQRYRTIKREVSLTLKGKARARKLAQLNERLEGTARQLRRASRARAVFLANTSHELKTPMTGLFGMLKLLRKTDLTAPQQEILDVAESAAEDLTVLMNDIVDLANLGRGKVRLQVLPFSPTALINRVVGLMQVEADDKGLALVKLDLPSEDLELLGDRARIAQILSNLLQNAITHTDEGYVQITLRLSSDEKGTLAIFQISDTGRGMTAEQRRRLFEPIETPATGAGLGFAICRQLTALMDGQISVESRPDIGTVVTVNLPLALVDEVDMTEAVPIAQRVDVQTNQSEIEHGQLNILVAEDNPINRMLVEKYLEQPGWQTTMVGNGKEAVLAASRGHYDIILMDIRMPQMDGIAATQEIRAAGNQVPILALTANTEEADIARYHAAGMNDVIGKPIDIERLFTLITHYGSLKEQAVSSPA